MPDKPRIDEARVPMWCELIQDGEFVERRTELLGGLVELIETCRCPGCQPCDFAACPKRPATPVAAASKVNS